MRSKTLGIAVALSFALALIGTVQAANLAGKGSVSGTVTGEDSKPVVGLAIKLTQDIPISAGSHGGKKGKSGIGNGDAIGEQAGGGGKEHTKTIAKGVTDAQGKFNFPNIDEGSYTLVAGSKNVGWIYQEVTVTANQETKLDDLKLIKVK